MKYSIIIPTYNHLDDCLKPCIESIKKYTTLDSNKLEIIIVSQCTENKNEYEKYFNELCGSIFDNKKTCFKVLWFDKGLGFSKAVNEGIKISTGEYIVVLNNDIELTEQEKDCWLIILEEKFIDSKIGIIGLEVIESYLRDNRMYYFLPFYCVMFTRKLVNDIGLLDEEYIQGYCEDIDYCIRSLNKDYIVTVTNKKVPLIHKGRLTYNEVNNMDKIKWFNENLFLHKHSNQIKYGNDNERFVLGKHDDIFQKLHKLEYARYKFASENLFGNKILEIGCSSGYGTKILPKNVDYLGLDYDPVIINFANRNFGDENHKFICENINNFFKDGDMYDTIIAFEVLEHISNGKEIAQELKKYCKNLLITFPYLEDPGSWGPHHVLHNLTEVDFPGFEYKWINPYGEMIDKPTGWHNAEIAILRWRKNDY